MEPKTYWAVKLSRTGTYLTSVDEDGRETIPLYWSKKAANDAAERSDLDDWTLVPVNLP